MQGRHNALKHLEDDRACDVGHDAQREYRHVGKCATGEKVQQGHRSRSYGITRRLEKAQHPLEGDTGHRNVCTDAVHHEHSDGEKNLSAQFLDTERVLQTI